MAYDFKNNPTNPDATPLYNDSVFKFWNWLDDVWSCNDWMNWHRAVKSKYGAQFAHDKFLSHWYNMATLSTAYDCRSFDKSFRDYMKGVGLLDALYAEGLGFIAKPIGVAGDVVTDAGEAISNTAAGAKKTVNTLAFLLPIIVIIALVFVVVYFSKKYNIKTA